MNLPLVLTLMIDNATPTQQLIDATVAEAREQLVQIKPVESKSEEDF